MHLDMDDMVINCLNMVNMLFYIIIFIEVISLLLFIIINLQI